MRSRGGLLWVLACLLLISLAVPASAENGPTSANGKSKKKKDKTYEVKQNLKKERKKLRREQKAKDREQVVSSLRRKKAAAERKKKVPTMSPELREHAMEKLAWLRKQTQKSADNIVSLSPDSYKEYVNDGPRLHWSLVVFTARGMRFRCSMCHQVHPHVKKIALSLNYTVDRPVFIMEVDVERNQDIFNEISLSHAPVFLMIPPTPNGKKPKIKTLYKKLPDKYRMNAHTNIGTDDLKKLIARHTKMEIELIEIIDYGNLVIMTAALGGLMALIYYRGNQFFLLRKYTLPYFGMCCVVFVWLMGGGMYNIIRGTPFMGEGFFHPSNGTQYGAGGLIVGCLHLGVGGVVILMNTWAMKQPQSKKKSKDYKSIFQRLRDLQPSAGLCLLGATFLWYNLVFIYTMKNRSYRLGFVQA